MADNYLERKMEEMRSGRSGSRPAQRAGGIPRGHIAVRFPASRALICGCFDAAQLDAISRVLTQAGCRTAVAIADRAAGEALAYSAGIRFCPLESSAMEETAVTKVFESLAEAWHDLDIAIVGGDPSMACALAAAWREFRSSHPHISDYAGRLLFMHGDNAGADSDVIKAICRELEGSGITATALTTDKADRTTILWLLQMPAALLHGKSL